MTALELIGLMACVVGSIAVAGGIVVLVGTVVEHGRAIDTLRGLWRDLYSRDAQNRNDTGEIMKRLSSLDGSWIGLLERIQTLEKNWESTDGLAEDTNARIQRIEQKGLPYASDLQKSVEALDGRVHALETSVSDQDAVNDLFMTFRIDLGQRITKVETQVSDLWDAMARQEALRAPVKPADPEPVDPEAVGQYRG